MKNQLSKREYKYRCKIIAENHLKKECQKYLDSYIAEKGVTYKDIYLEELTRLSWLTAYRFNQFGKAVYKELKPCPFCGSTDIRYSLKITGRFDVRYHASMYCNKCHCYGARTLTTIVKNDDYKGRTTIENDETVKQKAIDAWNERVE